MLHCTSEYINHLELPATTPESTTSETSDDFNTPTATDPGNETGEKGMSITITMNTIGAKPSAL